MSVRKYVDYDDALEHGFDVSELEISNGKGRQKSQVLTSEILFSNFDTDGDLVSKRGAKTLVLSGADNTGQVNGGDLNFPNQDISLGTYENIDGIVDDFSFRVKVIVNVAAVGTLRGVLSLDSNVDVSRIRIMIEPQGGGITRIKRDVRNASGTFYSTILATRDFSLNPNFEIAMSIDADGNLLTYIDGDLFDTNASIAQDFTDFDFKFGDEINNQTSCDYDNIQLWNSVVDLSGTGIAAEDTTYIITESEMETPIFNAVDEIIEFQIISETPVNTQLKHLVGLNLDKYYHDGANWVLSNAKLAQANTQTEINDNASTLPIVKGIGKDVKIFHIFKSDIGYATAEIEQMTVKFKMAFQNDDLDTCIVFGKIEDTLRNAVVGATIKVFAKDRISKNTFIGPDATGTTNAQGNFSLSIAETETDNTFVDFIITYTEDGEEVEKIVKKKVIPKNTASKKFSELTDLVEA